MFKKNKTIKIIFFSLFLFCCAFSSTSAQLMDTNEMTQQSNVFKNNAGFNTTTSLGEIIATVIKGFIGFLGIVFIVLLVMAGFKYMTARGNEEKTKEAIDSIRRAIIGLIIVLSAYAITYFVFNAIDWMGGGGGSGPTAS